MRTEARRHEHHIVAQHRGPVLPRVVALRHDAGQLLVALRPLVALVGVEPFGLGVQLDGRERAFGPRHHGHEPRGHVGYAPDRYDVDPHCHAIRGEAGCLHEHGGAAVGVVVVGPQLLVGSGVDDRLQRLRAGHRRVDRGPRPLHHRQGDEALRPVCARFDCRPPDATRVPAYPSPVPRPRRGGHLGQ